MASESRLYSFSEASKKHLQKFNLKASPAKLKEEGDMVATIYVIDKETLEVRPQEPKDMDDAPDDYENIYTKLEDIAEDLPDNKPRYILLGYTLPKSSQGISKVPYVMIYYLPATCHAESRMLYAGAKELLRNQSRVVGIVDLDDSDELMAGNQDEFLENLQSTYG